MIVSPTEPAKLRAVASSVSARLEAQYGSDVTFRSQGRWVGVQRKELADLVSSLGDGRLGVNLQQMQALDVAVLLIEGTPKFTLEGEMIMSYGRPLTLKQYRGIIWTAQAMGIWVAHTKTLDETVEWVQQFKQWCAKEKHTSLIKRGPVYSPWGKADNKDFARHLLMGLPGMGVDLADRILDMFGGLPWKWNITMEELMQVQGIGKLKAAKFMEVFGNEGV